MRIGLMNREVLIYRVTTAPDGAGGLTETRELISTCWGRVTSRLPREENRAGMTSNRSQYEITMRRLPGLLQTDELEYENKRLRIEAIDESARRDTVLVTARQHEVPGAPL